LEKKQLDWTYEWQRRRAWNFGNQIDHSRSLPVVVHDPRCEQNDDDHGDGREVRENLQPKLEYEAVFQMIFHSWLHFKRLAVDDVNLTILLAN